MLGAVASLGRPRFDNRVLDALTPTDLARLAPSLRSVLLSENHAVAMDASKYGAIFPQTCVVSLTAMTSDGFTLDVAKIGFEGCALHSTAAGTTFGFFVRRSGTAICVDTDILRRVSEASPQMQCTMANVQAAFTYEVARTAVCSAVHDVRERCIRSLLLMHDRVRGPLHLSHDVLANMVGVRRASISVVMFGLQRDGLIRYRRGNIDVVDYDALVTASCSCVRDAPDVAQNE